MTPKELTDEIFELANGNMSGMTARKIEQFLETALASEREKVRELVEGLRACLQAIWYESEEEAAKGRYGLPIKVVEQARALIERHGKDGGK